MQQSMWQQQAAGLCGPRELEEGAGPGLLPPGVLPLPGEADHQVVAPLRVHDVLLGVTHVSPGQPSAHTPPAILTKPGFSVRGFGLVLHQPANCPP